jgi:putative transposase
MKQRHPKVKLDELCRLFGISRQAWHQHNKALGRTALESEVVIQEVRAVRKAQPRVGTRKLLLHLGERLALHGIKLGRDKLFDLLGERGMLVRRRRRKAKTTDSDHPYRKYPNLIKELKPLKANELWVSDITYLDTGEGFAYLFLITDAYSHKIVGHALSESLEAAAAIVALRKALQQLPAEHRLVHHSDRGVQYCSHGYTELLESKNVRISMTENGDPRENAIAERVNGILKEEFLFEQIASKHQAKSRVEEAIGTYNNVRLHSSVDYLTPAKAHLRIGSLANRWKPKPASTVVVASFSP